jgi:hypothetical protein
MLTVSKGKRSEGMSAPSFWIKKDGKVICTNQPGNSKRITKRRHD